MSQIPKFEWGRERSPKRTTDFITSILAKKLENKTSAFYFILSPALSLQKVLGEKQNKKCNDVFLFHPKKTKNIFRTWRAEELMSIKRKQQKKKPNQLSPCPFSQFGAETQATARGNSLSAPEIITSAATSWQIGPCVRLEKGAHCPAWLFTELCLIFHGLTLFVFNRSTLPHLTHFAHRRLSPGSANIFSFLSYTEVMEVLFIQVFGFFLRVKMCHCQPKHFWCP